MQKPFVVDLTASDGNDSEQEQARAKLPRRPTNRTSATLQSARAARQGRAGTPAARGAGARKAATTAIGSQEHGSLRSSFEHSPGSSTGKRQRQASVPSLFKAAFANGAARAAPSPGPAPSTILRPSPPNSGPALIPSSQLPIASKPDHLPPPRGLKPPQPQPNGPTRQDIWRRLHEQDQQLAAQQDDLAAVDLASSERFIELVTKQNKTFDKINNGAMAAYDAAQHHLLSKAALQASASLSHLGKRTAKDLVGALLVHFGAQSGPEPSTAPARRSNGSVDWRQLGAAAAKLFRPVRGPSVMLGPLEVEPPKPQERVRERRKPVAAVVRPTVVDTTAEGATHKPDTFTAHIMDQMATRLRKLRPPADSDISPSEEVVALPNSLRLPLVAFRSVPEIVLDHAEFTQTVENSHAMGHLLATDWLQVYFRETGQMLLAALTKEEHMELRRARRNAAVVGSSQPWAAGPSQAAGGGGSAAGGPSGSQPGGSAGGAPTDAGGGNSCKHNMHFILAWEVSDWRKMCERVPRKRCIMDSRPFVPEDDEAGAAGGAVAPTRG